MLKDLIAPPEYNNIGFFASHYEKDNYKRLFARDAFWVIMASLLTGEDDLLKASRDSLTTLAGKQRDDGAIPSNVSHDGKVSYGIINQRIDPTTLYIIACSRFAKRYPAGEINKEQFAAIEKAVSYLENTWADNEYGLLYIPRSGNWADEYLQQGFVLYDEVLWYMAVKGFSEMLLSKGDARQSHYSSKAEKIRAIILEKFWVKDLPVKDNISKRVLKKIGTDSVGYLIHFFYCTGPESTGFGNPSGIFDAFGNILAVLAGIVPEDKVGEMISFIEKIAVNKYPLIPAHYPLFPEETFRSRRLHQYRFKQFIGHYHNGGLWSWYTGPYAAGLVKNHEKEKAETFLKGVMKANNEKKNGMDFYEYQTGKRAIAYMELNCEHGMDIYLSTSIGKIARRCRSMVLFHFNSRKADAEDDMSLRGLNAQKGDRLKVSAVGPDAEETLKKICELFSGDPERCCECKDIILKGSKPGGVPFLGVSAAAYIIAYKALFEGKIIFEECC